jgi:hypothetical protein
MRQRIELRGGLSSVNALRGFTSAESAAGWLERPGVRGLLGTAVGGHSRETTYMAEHGLQIPSGGFETRSARTSTTERSPLTSDSQWRR